MAYRHGRSFIKRRTAVPKENKECNPESVACLLNINIRLHGGFFNPRCCLFRYILHSLKNSVFNKMSFLQMRL